MSCFLFVLFYPGSIYSYFFFLSSVSSDLYPRVVLFVLVIGLLFSFRPNIFQYFTSVLSFLLAIIDVLFVFLV